MLWNLQANRKPHQRQSNQSEELQIFTGFYLSSPLFVTSIIQDICNDKSIIWKYMRKV